MEVMIAKKEDVKLEVNPPQSTQVYLGYINGRRTRYMIVFDQITKSYKRVEVSA